MAGGSGIGSGSGAGNRQRYSSSSSSTSNSTATWPAAAAAAAAHATATAGLSFPRFVQSLWRCTATSASTDSYLCRSSTTQAQKTTKHTQKKPKSGPFARLLQVLYNPGPENHKTYPEKNIKNTPTKTWTPFAPQGLRLRSKLRDKKRKGGG